jgi:hypothetical protein
VLSWHSLWLEYTVSNEQRTDEGGDILKACLREHCCITHASVEPRNSALLQRHFAKFGSVSLQEGVALNAVWMHSCCEAISMIQTEMLDGYIPRTQEGVQLQRASPSAERIQSVPMSRLGEASRAASWCLLVLTRKPYRRSTRKEIERSWQVPIVV